jgi:hypothetical protein
MDEGFRGSLHRTGLARSSRPEEQEIPHWPTGRGQASDMHLIDVDNLLYGFVLSYDEFEQGFLQHFGVFARARWV